MKNNLIKIFCTCLVFVFFNAGADTKPTQLESDLGIKFLFLEENSSPLINIMISFKNSGAAHFSKEYSSLPMLYAKTAPHCGSGNLDSAQLYQKLRNLSINLETYFSEDDVGFRATFPKVVLKEAISLLNDVIKLPKFNKDEVKLIQNVIPDSLQDYTASPRWFATNLFLPFRIFGDHPYARTEYGTHENVLKFTVEDIKKYKSKYIVTSNAQACIIGDLTQEEARNCLDKILEGVEKGEPANDNVSAAKIILSSDVKKYHLDGPQSTISFAIKSVKPNAQDFYAQAILRCILGGPIFYSRIMSKMRTQEGLVYGGFVKLRNLSHANYMCGFLQTDNSKVEKAIAMLKDILKDLRENGISEKDLEFAKNNLRGNFLVSLRTSRDLCDFFFDEMRIGVIISPQEYVENISKVKLEEVNKLASTILDENNISLVIIGGAAED